MATKIDSSVTREQFKNTLAKGVNLCDPATVRLLKPFNGGQFVAEAKRRIDTNGDGWLNTPAELDGLFNKADAFDRDGKGDSFSKTGRAAQLYRALERSTSGAPSPRGTVSRQDFAAALSAGINLRDPATAALLADQLGERFVTSMKRLDRNGDGLLNTPAELDKLFDHIERPDFDGLSDSFKARGPAGRVFNTLKKAVIKAAVPPPATGSGPR